MNEQEKKVVNGQPQTPEAPLTPEVPNEELIFIQPEEMVGEETEETEVV